jgi:hypothetical protein
MPELPDELAAAVTEQAEARVAMDIRRYARFLTAGAIDSLRASTSGMPPRVSRYEIGDVSQSGAGYSVDVRYFVRDTAFVVRSRWRRRDGEWVVIHAERLWGEEEKRPAFLSRMARPVLGALAARLRARRSGARQGGANANSRVTGREN